VTTKTEKAYIKSAIPNNEVSDKILEMIEAFDEGGGGEPLTTDIVTEGIVNKYYTEARVNANVDNKLATKAGKVLPVASQYVYVNYISGNDSTGDGASDTPFKTINVAMTSIVDASQNKPYVVGLLGARQIETGNILVKPYTSIVGLGQRATYVRSTGFNIKPDPSHSTGSSWVLLKNFYLGGGTGIDWDLQALGGSNSVVVIENMTIGGILRFKGRNAGGGDYLEMYTGIQFGTVTLDSTFSQIQTWELLGAVNFTNTQGTSGATINSNNTTFSNSLTIDSTTVSLNNAAYPGTSQLTTTGTVVINSYRGVPPVARQSLSVGTTLTETSEGAPAPENYIRSFNSTTDWTLNVDVYEIEILASNHGKGINPQLQTFETNGGDFDEVVCSMSIDSSGNAKIKVQQTPNLRFNGKIILS
jgi:hypothetical protein